MAALLAAAAAAAVVLATAPAALASPAAPSPPAPSRAPGPRPSPSPSPSPSPAPAPGGGTAGCGVLDVSCEIGSAVTSFLARLARNMLRPVLALAGRTLLSSPDPAAIPAARDMWDGSLAIADAAYVLLVLAGGVIVMSHETLQASYTVKDIAPRLVTGFVTANLSLPLISAATSLANGLSGALAGQAVTPAAAGQVLLGALTTAARGHSVFLILLALAGGLLGLVLVVIYVLRLMALVLLTAAAPLFLAAWALPQTGWAARWWWRALTAALAVQAAQALVLTAAVRVFASAGWLALHGTPPGLLPVITAICLLWIMTRIPWWITRPVLSPLGRSPLRRAARLTITAAVVSRVSPLLRGSTSGRAAGGGGRAGGGRPGGPRQGRGPGAGGTGPGPGQPGGSGPGRGQPGGSGPGRGHAGRTGPGRPGGAPGSRRGPAPGQAPVTPRPGPGPRRPPASVAARPGTRAGARPPARPRPAPGTGRPVPRAPSPAAPRPPGSPAPPGRPARPAPRLPAPPPGRRPPPPAGPRPAGPPPRPPRPGR